MKRTSRRILAVLLLGASFSAAAASGQPPSLPSPALDAVEPAVRRQLEKARGVAETALGDPRSDAAARAARVGALGRLYLLYSLLDSAEACFGTALELEPGDPDWNYYLAVLQQRQGRFDEAARRLETVAAIRPRDLPTLLRLGQTEISRGGTATAATWFQRALEIDPTSSSALYGLAQVAARQGDLDRAVPLFTAVLEAQPAASTAHYQLGLVLRRLGDLESARYHLERQGRAEVVFPDPLLDQLGALAEGASIRIAQATRASGRGDLATAEATLESAVEADPGNLTARLALATNLLRQDRLDDAAAELRQVLDRDADNAAALYNLGTVSARRGDLDSAIEQLTRATELAPGFADAYVNLAGLLHNQSRYGEALAALERALELEPGNVALELQRVEALQRSGRTADAADALAAAASRTAGDAGLLLMLGQAHETRGERDAALAAYRQAAALSQQDEAADAARRIALLLVPMGREQEGVAALDTALELRPGWVEALIERAFAYGRLESYEAARADFAAAIRLDPANEKPRTGLTVTLLLTERYQEVARHLEESVAAIPASIGLRHSLARFLATCPDEALRDGERALALAETIVRQERHLQHGETLAMALAEVGRFTEAATVQRQLVQAAGITAPEQTLDRMRQRLARYERGEPERAPWLPR